MITNTSIGEFSTEKQGSELSWRELYPLLRSLANHFVYSFKVSSWYGQEKDIIEDVVQETAIRVLERVQKAERGEATPIHCLEHMIWTIVRNYCLDIRRHDRRLFHTLTDDYLSEGYIVLDDQVNLTDEATENAYREDLFILLAYEIANFPDKQRIALLIDLANLMQFDVQPTPLQKAFLAMGIELKEYQQTLPANRIERSRHSSLLSVAYKRLAQLPGVQQYISATWGPCCPKLDKTAHHQTISIIAESF
jgi:DNA-directed RNA polymerase specialized sigma24 family protein